jgi:hypothetical protein
LISSVSGDNAGALELISFTSGARVYLSGVDTGYETNVIIENLLPGNYTVKIVKSGYQTDTAFPYVIPRDTTVVVIYLYPGP